MARLTAQEDRASRTTLICLTFYFCLCQCSAQNGHLHEKQDGKETHGAWGAVRGPGTRRHDGGLSRSRVLGYDNEGRAHASLGGPRYNLKHGHGDNDNTTADPSQPNNINPVQDTIKNETLGGKDRHHREDYQYDSGGPNDYNIYHRTQRSFDWGRFVLFLLLCMGGGISVAIAIFFCGRKAKKHTQKKQIKLECMRLNEINEATLLRTAALFDTNPLVPRMYPGQSLTDLYTHHFCHLDGHLINTEHLDGHVTHTGHLDDHVTHLDDHVTHTEQQQSRNLTNCNLVQYHSCNPSKDNTVMDFTNEIPL